MFCRCPHCNKQKQVNAKQLRDSRGLLKCKRCGQSFDALASLSEKGEKTPIRPDRYSGLPFERPKKGRLPWFWGIASLVMFAGLLAQVVYFDGRQWYGQPAINRGLTKACEILNCRLPVISNPEEWAVSHTELQLQLNNRYWLTAALTNQAELIQAFPKLKLTLTDFDGRILAERIFLPRQYTVHSDLGANETVQIRLPFVAIAGDIGGFSLTAL